MVLKYIIVFKANQKAMKIKKQCIEDAIKFQIDFVTKT